MLRRIDYGERGDEVRAGVHRVIVERGDEVRAGVHRVIVERGVEALSLRNVAEQVGLSPATILYQFTDRARLLRVTAGRAATARIRWISHLAGQDGVLAFLPGDGDDWHAELTRVRLAFLELSRGDDDLGAIVAHQRAEERELLAWAAGTDLDESALDGLVAVVEGLTAAMFARSGALALDRARAALRAHLQATGIPGHPRSPRGWDTSAGWSHV